MDDPLTRGFDGVMIPDFRNKNEKMVLNLEFVL